MNFLSDHKETIAFFLLLLAFTVAIYLIGPVIPPQHLVGG